MKPRAFSLTRDRMSFRESCYIKHTGQLYCQHKSSNNVSGREREKEMGMRCCMRNLEAFGNLRQVQHGALPFGLAKSIFYTMGKSLFKLRVFFTVKFLGN